MYLLQIVLDTIFSSSLFEMVSGLCNMRQHNADIICQNYGCPRQGHGRVVISDLERPTGRLD